MADLASLSSESREAVAEKAGKLMDAGLGQAEADERAFDELIREKQALAENKPGGFRFQRIGDIPLTPPRWLIKGLLEADTFAEIYGDPGTCKSFWAIELACCVASGTPFFGFEVRAPGPVYYLAAEGRGGLIRRFSAWSIARKVALAELPLYLSMKHPVPRLSSPWPPRKRRSGNRPW